MLWISILCYAKERSQIFCSCLRNRLELHSSCYSTYSMRLDCFSFTVETHYVSFYIVKVNQRCFYYTVIKWTSCLRYKTSMWWIGKFLSIFILLLSQYLRNESTNRFKYVVIKLKDARNQERNQDHKLCSLVMILVFIIYSHSHNVSLRTVFHPHTRSPLGRNFWRWNGTILRETSCCQGVWLILWEFTILFSKRNSGWVQSCQPITHDLDHSGTSPRPYDMDVKCPLGHLSSVHSV